MQVHDILFVCTASIGEANGLGPADDLIPLGVSKLSGHGKADLPEGIAGLVQGVAEEEGFPIHIGFVGQIQQSVFLGDHGFFGIGDRFQHQFAVFAQDFSHGFTPFAVCPIFSLKNRLSTFITAPSIPNDKSFLSFPIL